MNIVKFYLYLMTLVFLPRIFYAQIGGKTTFPMLDMGFSARSIALGTDFISVKDQDVTMALNNPSLLNEKMLHQGSVNQSFSAGGISYGMVNYAFKTKIGLFAPAVRYLNYGTFQRTNNNGTEEGKFNPFDAIIGTSYSRMLNPRISVGANLNVIFSQLEIYNAFGISLDLASAYQSKDSNLLVTVIAKNAGFQFKDYYTKSKQSLPIEFQMAISYKIKHAPFRFSLLAHHLNQWDITYRDPNLKPTKDPLTGEIVSVKYAGWGEKLARHFTYQVEVLISKNITFNLAFDYHRRQEMKLVERPGISGFSTGLNLNFKKISFAYGFAYYSRAGFNNTLTLRSNLSTWRK